MQVALTSLWLPILLSTVAVYIASSLIWAVIQYHNSDWRELPDEAEARSALKGVAPGQYSVPHAVDGKAGLIDAAEYEATKQRILAAL